jgi:hypothetical protein
MADQTHEEQLYAQIRGMSTQGKQVPEQFHEPIINYIAHRRPVGSFLEAVISNDFIKAVTRADEEALENIPAFAVFFIMWAPADCYGSRGAYWKWIGSKRQEPEEQQS